VSQQDGAIKVYAVARGPTGEYAVTDEDTIGVIRSMANYDDDGSSATEFSDVVEAVVDRLGL
jgi:hypothetical protein